MDDLDKTPEGVAAQIVTDATQVAREVVARATDTAAKLVEAKDERDARITSALAGALREVFGEHEATKRFVDVTRIPLICQSIVSIHTDIGEIKVMMKEADKRYVNQDQFELTRKLVYGLLGIVGATVLAALLKLIILP